MALFSSIQLANTALRAQQIGLQVVGQNIANANTPGYIREEVVLKPAPTQRIGGLLLGLGVEVKGIVQKFDAFLAERVRVAESDRAAAEAEEQVFLDLEVTIGELGETDISTALTSFFNSIHEIFNQPESTAARNLAVLQGKTLTSQINQLARRVETLRKDANQQVIEMAESINQLAEEIRVLNIRIVQTEGGRTLASDAVGLRDQRQVALTNLANLIDIRTVEQQSGAVNVFSAGDFLVFEGSSRKVRVTLDTDRGLSIGEIRFEETGSLVDASSGELSGLLAARDVALRDFLVSLDSFTNTMVFEFNKLHSSGQGQKGFDSLTAEHPVDNATLALDAAGLPFTPQNGSFKVQVFNKQTGLTTTNDIFVKLNGLFDDTTLADLSSQLNAIGGVSSAIQSTGHLQISSDSANLEFTFADDTSGILASLGLNTFFTGTSALNMGVNSVLTDNPARFAAGRAGIGSDTQNAEKMATFLDQPLDTAEGATLNVLYSRITSEVTQGSTVAQSVAEGLRIFEQTLNGQQLAISGVSLDEEAIRMISFQQAFQATARYIRTLSELLDILSSL